MNTLARWLSLAVLIAFLLTLTSCQLPQTFDRIDGAATRLGEKAASIDGAIGKAIGTAELVREALGGTIGALQTGLGDVKAKLAAADANKDGKLDRDELLKWLAGLGAAGGLGLMQQASKASRKRSELWQAVNAAHQGLAKAGIPTGPATRVA